MSTDLDFYEGPTTDSSARRKTTRPESPSAEAG